jgi:hypothetical protein
LRGTPETGADEFDGGEIVFWAPVMTAGDVAEPFDPIEEACDEEHLR